METPEQQFSASCNRRLSKSGSVEGAQSPSRLRFLQHLLPCANAYLCVAGQSSSAAKHEIGLLYAFYAFRRGANCTRFDAVADVRVGTVDGGRGVAAILAVPRLQVDFGRVGLATAGNGQIPAWREVSIISGIA